MKLKANAKINLSLKINGKREDGYHLIDTVMHSISLYDEIEIEKAKGITVKCDKYAIEQEKNIAYKAAKLFFEDYGIKGGVDISIKKNIPSPAGLGGGSADAAAVLLGLRSIYKNDISNADLEKTALKLGADVPFFIEGGCKRAEGIGEILSDVTPLNNGYILLALAETKPSTAEMYRIVDKTKPLDCDTDMVIKAIEQNDIVLLSKSIANSFSAVWENSFVKKALLEQSPLAVSLTGSGPTWFALFDNCEKAEKAKSVLCKQNITCFIATPQAKAIIFE